MKRLAVVMAIGAASCGAQQPAGCFATLAAAAAQNGAADPGGFRLEALRHDQLGGRTWATVRSCAHPEWPSVMVAGRQDTTVLSNAARDGTLSASANLRGRSRARTIGQQPGVAAATAPEPLLVTGGLRVHVVQTDKVSRLEMTGLTQGGGRLGDLVWVRILPPGVGPGDPGRMEQAVIRSADLLEVTR